MNKYIRRETYRDGGRVVHVWGLYYDCIIEYRQPQGFYCAMLPAGGYVQADTLAGIKGAIRDAVKRTK